MVTGDTDDDASIHLNAFVGRAKPLPIRNNENRQKNSSRSRNVDDVNAMFREFQEKGSIFVDQDAGKEDERVLEGEHHPQQVVGTNKNDYNNDEDDDLESEDDDYSPENEDEDDLDSIQDDTYAYGDHSAEPYTALYDYLSESDEDYNYSEPDSDVWSLDLEETNVEDATVEYAQPKEKPHRKRRKSDLVNLTAPSILERIKFPALVVSAIAFAVLLLVLIYSLIPESVGPDSLPRLNLLQRKLGDLSARQDQLRTSLEDHSDNIVSKFDYISSKFDEIDAKLRDNQWKALLAEVETLKRKVEVNSGTNLAELDEKLHRIDNMYDTFERAKLLLVTEFIDKLPEKVPAYIQDNKIHFAPEFHRYLLAFIENYNQQKGNQTWNQFLEHHQAQLNGYLTAALKLSSVVTKQELEVVLNKRLAENNQAIWSRFNGLVDSVLANSTTLNVAADGVMLDSLLDVFARSSKSVNYADYQLGSRILGFLTSAGPDSRKLLSRRIFLGWYDYLTGPSSPSNWKYNANNVLVDNGDLWDCGAHCSIGVRLFESVLITDLVVHSRGAGSVSVYVKPRYSKHFDQVQKYAGKLKFTGEELENKYARKFIKVKEMPLVGEVNHVHMPRTLVNMEVPVRDVVLEITGDATAAVDSVKVYGVKEAGARQLRQDLWAMAGDQVYLGDDIIVD